MSEEKAGDKPSGQEKVKKQKEKVGRDPIQVGGQSVMIVSKIKAKWVKLLRTSETRRCFNRKFQPHQGEGLTSCSKSHKNILS